MVRLAMKTLIVSALLFTLAPASGADGDEEKYRVACVGDSITYGAGVEKREKNCYPVQLGRLLGDGCEVRNFGVSGATLLSKGDKPYIKERAYRAVKLFKPKVIIIMLGTNDTKPQNWKHAGDFVADYKAMIKELSALPSKPKIYLCTPVPAYPGNFGIEDERIKTGVKPVVEQIAGDTGSAVIDLYKALSDQPKLFPDKVHPNAKGAALIAKTVYEAVREDNK